MSIFKRKIKNTFDVARDMGVDEEKIKELKEGERQVEGATMDKVLQSVNKSQVERDIEKLNIFEWYKNTDLKVLRKEFGYKNAVALADVLKIENSSISRAENKKYDKVNKTIIKLYDFYHNDFNKNIKEEEQMESNEKSSIVKDKEEKKKIYQWYLATDIEKLRGNLSQKAISNLIGMGQSNWCQLERHQVTRYCENMEKIYNHFHGSESQNSLNSEELKTDEKDIIAESQNMNNNEDSILDKFVETENFTTCDCSNEKDLTELSKYVGELKNRIEEQNKEIGRLTRQVYCYEKLIERL
jgi:transcriptional regulator with XRE-family HTH domain